MEEEVEFAPQDGGWTVQITKNEETYVAWSGGKSASGETPGDAVTKLYSTLF